jgi:hypothetical protein
VLPVVVRREEGFAWDTMVLVVWGGVVDGGVDAG